jgi:hypothetical protein
MRAIALATAAVLAGCSDSPPPPVGQCCGYAVEVLVPISTCDAGSADAGRVDAGPSDAGCALAGTRVNGDACTEALREAIQCAFAPITCSGSPGELWCGPETDQGTAQTTASSFAPLFDAGWPNVSAQGNCNCISN